ncbi:MAG: hypothetical protein FJ146_10490 [Deltaproteobacteria bacterium]|nr:hypothetical protein [Deltaproteobacteria bacterium]
MSDKWHIYKGNKELGVMTAEEIRAGLRDGSLDPFDTVARDGSSLRREIFEVDEIFSVTAAVYDEMSTTAIKRQVPGNNEFHEKDADLSGTGLGRSHPSNDRHAIGEGQLHLATSAQSTVRAKNAGDLGKKRGEARRPRNPKQYYLSDRDQKSMGPLSIDEIRSLFYRGVLPKDVRVMREGSTAQVSVGKFLAVYTEGQHKPMELGGHPRAPRYTSQISRRTFEVQGVSPLAIAALFVGFLLLGAAAVLIWDTKLTRSPTLAVVNASTTNLKKNPKKPGKIGPATSKDEPAFDDVPPPPSETRLPIPAPPMLGTAVEVEDAAEEPVVTRSFERPASRTGRIGGTVAPVKSPPLRTQTARRQTRPQPSRRGSQSSMTRVTVTRPERSRTQPVMAVGLSARAPINTVQSAAPRQASGGTRSIDSLADGAQVQNFGPMSFDRTALSQCAPACTLMFSGPSGTVRGTFFKKVWGPALERSSGSVYLSGSVRKSEGGTKIILNGVK